MRDRAMDWLNEAVRGGEGAVFAICHGGPIAAIRGSLGGVPVTAWPTLVPRYGEIVTIDA
jgi:broad specificity phosphatase PhoE